MSRRAVFFGILGLAVVVGLGLGGSWLADRTILARDEIRVRIARATLIDLITRDMVGDLKNKKAIVQVSLPRLDLPMRLLLVKLNPKALKRQGISRSSVVTAIREKALAVKTREPPATIDVRNDRISVALPGFGVMNPEAFKVVQNLRFHGSDGDVWIRRLAEVNVAFAPGVTEERDRNFPLVRIMIESRWRYPEARGAVETYLDSHAKWVKGKRRNGKLYEFVTERR